MLSVENLKKTYDTGDEALKGVSMEVSGNEVVAIIGPSGAGKSTFIRCINQLTEPTAGSVELDGVDLTRLSTGDLRKQRRNMGMIFQEYGLVDRLTVMENVLSGRLGYVSAWNAFRRNFPPEDVRHARATLDRVGLAGYDDNRADELSGGQRQRVGIARAVVQRPKILLVDEPTSSLDPESSRAVMDLLTEIAREENIPVLINIHEVELALEYADRVVGFADGLVVFEGGPDEVDGDVRDTIYRGGEPKSDGSTHGESAGGGPADDDDRAGPGTDGEDDRSVARRTDV